MNLRKKGHSDSLELLLNTMCNTFGGIVMISLVMALLTRDSSPDAMANARAERWRGQIQDAANGLDDARKLQQSLASNDQAARSALALAEERARLEKRIAEERAATESNSLAAAKSVPPDDSESLQRLRSRETALSSEVTEMLAQLERVKKSHQRELRLPRERASGKKPFYFIVRYGRVYPIAVFHDGERELNTESIDWRQSKEGRVATPRKDAPPASVPPFAKTVRELEPDRYLIHFIVYNDSFATFLSARQIPLQSGYDTGWEFLTEDREVIFSAGGEAPPAL